MTDQYPNTTEIRRWAQAQSWGHKVADSGKMPWQVFPAWNKAHPARPYVKGQAHHGTARGYNDLRCHCDRCAEWARARERDIRARRSER